MATAEQWLLPDGIEELYPQQARVIESLRRELLSLYECWGYELVFPPLVEYLESLHTGMGRDLALQTLTITDQLTGRLMGFRADITPQVARIDAHGLKRQGPVRLCYAGSVLHATPNLSGSRALIQVGVELFGHDKSDSDVEVIELMLRTLYTADCQSLTLDLGNVAICQQLLASTSLSTEQRSQLFAIYERKAIAELDLFLETHIHEPKLKNQLRQLPLLAGDARCLQQARTLFADNPGILTAVNELEEIAQRILDTFPQLPIYYDLSELRGYHYHTGVVFAAYTPAYGQAIAKGGRYDDVGEKFGRARPATGFSTDIKTLALLGNYQTTLPAKIFAPAGSDSVLRLKIASLRNQGEIVIQELAGQQQSAKESGCDRQLILKNNEWVLVKI